MPELDGLRSAAEVAALLGLSEYTVNGHARVGRFPGASKIPSRGGRGGRWVFTEESIRAYIGGGVVTQERSKPRRRARVA